MATELNEKVGLTKAARDNIKQALYNKTGVTQSDDIRTYANVIANIPTGIDTSDATAAANSIISGKTAYVNGVKITGTMYDIGPNTNGHAHGYIGVAGATASRTMDNTNSCIKYRMTQTNPNPIVYTYGAYDEIWENFTNLANVINLTPNILQKNKTVLGITGTLESLDTTDATANSYDIALGQTAYVNGQKLTGNVTTINNGINTYCSNNSILIDISALNRIQAKCTFSNNIMFRKGSELMIDVPYSNFISVNNLTADNIKSGVNLFGITGNLDSIPNGIFIQNNIPTKTTAQALWLKEENNDKKASELIPLDTTFYATIGTYQREYTWQYVLSQLTTEQIAAFDNHIYHFIIYNRSDSQHINVDIIGCDEIPMTGSSISLNNYTGIKCDCYNKSVLYGQAYGSYNTQYEPIIFAVEDLYSTDNVKIKNSSISLLEDGLYIDVDDTRYMVYMNKAQEWTKILDSVSMNASSADILINKTAIVNNTKITGTMNNLGDISIVPNLIGGNYGSGYVNSINISAVTNAIDVNITPENIVNRRKYIRCNRKL